MEVAAAFIVIAIPTVIVVPILLMIHFSSLKREKSSIFILTLIFLFMIPTGITIGAILGLFLDKLLRFRIGSSDLFSSLYIFTFYVVVPILMFIAILKKTNQIEEQNKITTNKQAIKDGDEELVPCEICGKIFHMNENNSLVCPKCIDSYFKNEVQQSASVGRRD